VTSAWQLVLRSGSPPNSESDPGVRVVFQVTPGTEAPAEMNFCFPDRRALCMAENATHTLHQILTLRGAEVRDARAWSRYLGEAVAWTEFAVPAARVGQDGRERVLVVMRGDRQAGRSTGGG
jgi:hypothetical protein